MHWYRPNTFGNIKIFGNTADKAISGGQIIAGQFQFGDGLSCISQRSAAGRVWFTQLPTDKRHRSSRRTAVSMNQIFAAGQWYVVWSWILWTCNAVWGFLILDTITTTFVDWKTHTMHRKMHCSLAFAYCYPEIMHSSNNIIATERHVKCSPTLS